VASGVTASDQDFVADFRRAALVQLQRQGGFARSGDPAHPARLAQGVLLTVQGVSPSAGAFEGRSPRGKRETGCAW
jgi:hypothetical protein